MKPDNNSPEHRAEISHATDVPKEPKHHLPIKVLLIAIIFGLGSVVGVYGYQWYQMQNQPVEMPVETPRRDVPTNTNETSDWETYRNEEYGFVVEYPLSLQPEEINNNDTLLSLISFNNSTYQDPNRFAITIRTLRTLSEEVAYYKQGIEGHVITQLVNEEEVYLRNFKAVRLDYNLLQEGSSTTAIIVNNNKYSYIISANTKWIDQILSTFRFLEE